MAGRETGVRATPLIVHVAGYEAAIAARMMVAVRSAPTDAIIVKGDDSASSPGMGDDDGRPPSEEHGEKPLTFQEEGDLPQHWQWRAMLEVDWDRTAEQPPPLPLAVDATTALTAAVSVTAFGAGTGEDCRTTEDVFQEAAAASSAWSCCASVSFSSTVPLEPFQGVGSSACAAFGPSRFAEELTQSFFEDLALGGRSASGAAASALRRLALARLRPSLGASLPPSRAPVVAGLGPGAASGGSATAYAREPLGVPYCPAFSLAAPPAPARATLAAAAAAATDASVEPLRDCDVERRWLGTRAKELVNSSDRAKLLWKSLLPSGGSDCPLDQPVSLLAKFLNMVRRFLCPSGHVPARISSTTCFGHCDGCQEELYEGSSILECELCSPTWWLCMACHAPQAFAAGPAEMQILCEPYGCRWFQCRIHRPGEVEGTYEVLASDAFLRASPHLVMQNVCPENLRLRTVVDDFSNCASSGSMVVPEGASVKAPSLVAAAGAPAAAGGLEEVQLSKSSMIRPSWWVPAAATPKWPLGVAPPRYSSSRTALATPRVHFMPLPSAASLVPPPPAQPLVPPAPCPAQAKVQPPWPEVPMPPWFRRQVRRVPPVPPASPASPSLAPLPQPPAPLLMPPLMPPPRPLRPGAGGKDVAVAPPPSAAHASAAASVAASASPSVPPVAPPAALGSAEDTQTLMRLVPKAPVKARPKGRTPKAALAAPPAPQTLPAVQAPAPHPAEQTAAVGGACGGCCGGGAGAGAAERATEEVMAEALPVNTSDGTDAPAWLPSGWLATGSDGSGMPSKVPQPPRAPPPKALVARILINRTAQSKAYTWMPIQEAQPARGFDGADGDAFRGGSSSSSPSPAPPPCGAEQPSPVSWGAPSGEHLFGTPVKAGPCSEERWLAARTPDKPLRSPERPPKRLFGDRRSCADGAGDGDDVPSEDDRGGRGSRHLRRNRKPTKRRARSASRARAREEPRPQSRSRSRRRREDPRSHGRSGSRSPPASRRRRWLPLRRAESSWRRDDDPLEVWRRCEESEEKNTSKELRILPVREVRFTQDSIAHSFSDGRSLEALIEALQQGYILPLSVGFLVLDAVEVDRNVFCMNNRRLWCLYQYQQMVDTMVMVRLRVTRTKDPTLRQFLRAFTTNDCGHSVRRRAPPPAGGSALARLPRLLRPATDPAKPKRVLPPGRLPPAPPLPPPQTAAPLPQAAARLGAVPKVAAAAPAPAGAAAVLAEMS